MREAFDMQLVDATIDLSNCDALNGFVAIVVEQSL